MKQKIIDKGLYIQIMQCSLEVRMENKIEFINKVYMGKEAKSGKKVFSVIAGVLLLQEELVAYQYPFYA